MRISGQVRLRWICGLAVALALTACDQTPTETAEHLSDDPVSVSSGSIDSGPVTGADDLVARVGDQEIRFSHINTMLNSSAVVGVSVPALGTPDRDNVRIVLLDKMVSANLLYLDALEQGVDDDPAYRRDMLEFRNAILAALYRDRFLSAAVTITDKDIEAYYHSTGGTDTGMTDDVRTAIESVLRKQQFDELSARARPRLREGLEIRINEDQLDPLRDAGRDDSAVLATIDGKPVFWGEAKSLLGGRVSSSSLEDRRHAINNLIDQSILVQKANAAGLDRDPLFLARYEEYQKTRLINLHRGNLAAQFEPTQDALLNYYETHRNSIMTPEFRKVQLVVVESEAQATNLKARIDAGEITMFQAASDYSIDPGAKQNLGELGWQSRGRGWPALDEVIFSLGPGEVGGPIETPAGWNLLLVQDVREARYDDPGQEATRRMTRRKYIHDKLDDYVVNLRKNRFPVEVYEDTLVRLSQQEVDMVQQLAQKAAEQGSITRQRLEELQKIYGKGTE